MLLFVLAYIGGVLTIASPCILPVLPFVFARADQPFLRRGLPMLLGMAATFAIIATLAAVGGGWAVQANEYGRYAAIALLALFGVTLLFPELSDRLTRPLVAAGGRLSESADRNEHAGGVWPSLLLGVATGLLWAPCAGPVLGLILTGAALEGANVQTTLLLLAYAAGAATSLALALLVGGRVFAAMKRSLGAGEWVRRGLGAAVLVAVVAIAFGVDTGFLTQVSLANTASLEQSLVDRFRPAGGRVDAKPPSSTVMSGGRDDERQSVDGDERQAAEHGDERRPGRQAGRGGVVLDRDARRAGRDDERQPVDDDERQAAEHGDERRPGRDDEGGAGRRVGKSAGRRRAAVAFRGCGVVELAAAHCRIAEGQGGAGRLLDLFLHQLPALDSLRPRLGAKIQGPGPGRDRRARAGISVREEHRQCKERRRQIEDRLSRRDRQRLRDLARVQQRILAGGLFHRRGGPHPPPLFRRGRLRPVRDSDPRTARGSRQTRSARERRCGQCDRRGSRVRRTRRQIARNLYRLHAGGELRFAGRGGQRRRA